MSLGPNPKRFSVIQRDEVLDQCLKLDNVVRTKLGIKAGQPVPAHQKELYAAMMDTLRNSPPVKETDFTIQASDGMKEWVTRDPVDLDNFSCLKACSQIGYGPGGPEGVAQELRSLAMDADGSGGVTEEEMEATAASTTNAINELLINMGIVGALLLGIVLPFVFTPLEPAPQSLEYFGDVWCDIFGHSYHILMTIVVMLCINIVFMTLAAYKWLNFWMVDAEMQLFFAKTSSTSVTTAVIAFGQAILWIIPFTLPLGCAFFISPISGAYSLGIVLLMFAQLLSFFQQNEFFYAAYKHTVCRKVLQELNQAELHGNPIHRISEKKNPGLKGGK
jgi:hypothetical protein